jgi:hypothetical protein
LQIFRRSLKRNGWRSVGGIQCGKFADDFVADYTDPVGSSAAVRVRRTGASCSVGYDRKRYIVMAFRGSIPWRAKCPRNLYPQFARLQVCIYIQTVQ